MNRNFLSIALLIAGLILPVAGPALGASTNETLTTDLSSAAGIPWLFRPEGGAWKAIQVPAGGWRAQGYTCDAGTYRAALPLPANTHGRILRVLFSAVNFGADVSAGPDEAHLTKIGSHIDGWVPFSAELPPALLTGPTILLEVEVKGRRKFMHNGRYTVPEGATWDDKLEEGILRGVALQSLPPVHIDNIFVRARLSPDTLQPQVSVTNSSSKPATVSIAGHLRSWNGGKFKYPHIPSQETVIRAGESRTVDLGEVKWTPGPESYWWPNVPYRPGYKAQLHILDVSLKVNGQTVHQTTQRFGFRQFTVRGNHYELNGIRCNLRGDNQQEADFGADAYGIRPGFGPPSPGNAGWPQAVDNILHLNFNVMRIHQIPATPYMLDVCDEQGLMLVDESPLRGSEGGEDWAAGRDNMKNMDRELVLRDRNHPAVVIWSAANEWAAPIPEVVPVMRAVDDTRPIIADGVGDLGPSYINMQHYVNGLGGLPLTGGQVRADRPYGETEAIWPMDNTWQGFAWMAASIRIRRLKGDADLRNYVLNNAWSNYVPGEGPDNEILEKKVKNMGSNMEIRPALTDPWHNRLIRLMQKCYHPVAVCDTDFDWRNARSNDNGDWPVFKPRLVAGSHVVRRLAVFNDEFSGDHVTVHWQLRAGGDDVPRLAGGTFNMAIPLGEFRTQDIEFECPTTPGDLTMLLTTSKGGQERFVEDQVVFSVVAAGSQSVVDGNYRLINRHSTLLAGLAEVTTANGSPVVQAQPGAQDSVVWTLKNAGNDDVTFVNKKTGLALGVRDSSGSDNAIIIQETPNQHPDQTWHLDPVGDGYYTLMNKGSGKVLDVFSSSTVPGARIVQWELNGGDNQEWELKKE